MIIKRNLDRFVPLAVIVAIWALVTALLVTLFVEGLRRGDGLWLRAVLPAPGGRLRQLVDIVVSIDRQPILIASENRPWRFRHEKSPQLDRSFGAARG